MRAAAVAVAGRFVAHTVRLVENRVTAMIPTFHPFHGRTRLRLDRRSGLRPQRFA